MLLFTMVECFISCIVGMKSHWKDEVILEYGGVTVAVIGVVGIILSVRVVIVGKESIVLVGVVEAALGGAGAGCEAVVYCGRVLGGEETCVADGVGIIKGLILVLLPVGGGRMLLGRDSYLLLLLAIDSKEVVVHFLRLDRWRGKVIGSGV